MEVPKNKDEFVKYLRKKQISFSEFYDVMLKSYFNLTTDERKKLIETTGSYRNMKRNY